jgi:DNA modification methylase
MSMAQDILTTHHVSGQSLPRPRSPFLAELTQIEASTVRLENKYQGVMKVDPLLTRQIVSFQANKERPRYRWYKYKEGFSAELVEHFLQRCTKGTGKVLDPFAGSGATLFAASGLGCTAVGIELLPIGVRLMNARRLVEEESRMQDQRDLRSYALKMPWRNYPDIRSVPELRITQGAYPAATNESIQRCLAWIESLPLLQKEVSLFALLAILESVSYTRKDGQYLRWDHRSGRRQGTRPFDKGVIRQFDDAYAEKLLQIVGDVSSSGGNEDLFKGYDLPARHNIEIIEGSCLNLLPGFSAKDFDAIVTSPPYCNRYDYTRTYALELAMLGTGEAGVVNLRQSMLSCTVENRAKDLLSINSAWSPAIAAAQSHPTLALILQYLESLKEAGIINNNGIPRMVRSYFFEMACVIQECARVLKPGSPMVMVNDNVRYAGAAIPVDLILSDFAQALGFFVEAIRVLPGGKGNSSQQMGEHGRQALRKCVYVWRKHNA